METSELDNQEKENQLELSSKTQLDLLSAGKWAKFLSILGFIFTGIMLIFGLGFGIFMSVLPTDVIPMGLPGFAFSLIYILSAILYFLPVLYLYRFSTNAIKAIKEKDKPAIELSINNLKKNFKYVGILTIALIGLYFIAAIVAAIVTIVFGANLF